MHEGLVGNQIDHPAEVFERYINYVVMVCFLIALFDPGLFTKHFANEGTIA